MNYISLYRKYKPNNFNKIIGQIEIKKALKNSIINNKISHAYLFSGPHGTGKTSIAKIFAKAINCNNLDNGNPCNLCINCNGINYGISSSIDIFEIDAASNNSIDDIREIINNIQLFPRIAKYKVYIIDEIHMLTNSAFNSFLKTLEDPPKHVVFILATTENYKIPLTIISRCQQYNFHKISKIELEKNIINILQKEKIKYNLDAIKEITNLSDGSVRDSLNILEQIIIFSESNITIENINIIFSMVSKNIKIKLLEDIIEYKTTEVLLTSKKIYKLGSDFEILILNLLDIIKEIFEFKQTNNIIFLNSLSKEKAELFSNKLSSKELINLLDLFIEAANTIKNSKIQEIYFELILLKALSLFKNNIKNLNLNNLIILDNKNKEKKNFNIIKENLKNKEITKNNKIIYLKEKNIFNIEKSFYNFSLPNNEKTIFNFFNEKKQKQNKIIKNKKNNKYNLNEKIEKKDFISIKSKEVSYEKKTKLMINLQKYRYNIKNKNNIYEFSNINYSNEQIFNILINANKEERKKFENRFIELILKENKIIKLNKLISFYDIKYVAASKQGLIVVTNTKPEANWISFEICDLEFRNNIFKLFNFNFIIIALSENEWNNVRVDYYKIKKENKLPKSTLINIEDFYKELLFKKIDNYDKHKKNIENGKQIFDNIKIIK